MIVRYQHNGNNYIAVCEKTGEQELVLLRLFGQSPEVYVPQMAEGFYFTCTGAYCFAATNKKDNEYEAEFEQEESVQCCRESYVRLCGKYITSVSLPDSIKTLSEYTFYGCGNLESLELGKETEDIHNDVFMNCRKLCRLVIRADIQEKTGLRLVLNQLKSEIYVIFKKDDNVQAALFYPEYSESYEEIGPAHIFGVKVEGEGYRARLLFNDGVVDIAKYDEVFIKAVSTENKEILMNMAFARLQFPYRLSDNSKLAYMKFVKDNSGELACICVKKRNLSVLQFICENNMVDLVDLREALSIAVENDFSKGASVILNSSKYKDLSAENGSSFRGRRYSF